MKIQDLGPGCPRCQRLGQVAREAADGLGLRHELVKVTGLKEITGFGVMMTPALAVDGQVKVAGKVPSVDEAKRMLQQGRMCR